MTSTQYNAIMDLIYPIMEDAGSIHQLMHGARIKMDYGPSEANAMQALELVRMVHGLLTVNLERTNQLILELERSRDLS